MKAVLPRMPAACTIKSRRSQQFFRFENRSATEALLAMSTDRLRAATAHLVSEKRARTYRETAELVWLEGVRA